MGENIPAPADGSPFSIEECMASIMRNPRRVMRREDIAELPAPRSLDVAYKHWSYLPNLMQHDRTWKVAIHNHYGGNSYFAAVAMLIYGDANLWFWTRIQHLQFFEQVISRRRGETAHPRHTLYNRFNNEKSGPNNFSLQERLSTLDYWVDHLLLSQVTADLYGIYLVVYTHHSGREGTSPLLVFHEVYTAVQARGNYNSPHHFLRYTDNRHYQPLIPAEYDRPSEFRAPEFKFVRGHPGMTDPAMVPEDNEGVNHPWRKPYPDVPVLDRLAPTPITTLVLKDLDTRLQVILWVKFSTPTAPPPSIHTEAAEPDDSGTLLKNPKCSKLLTPEIDDRRSGGPQTTNAQQSGGTEPMIPPNTTASKGQISNFKPVCLPQTPQIPIDYYRKSLNELVKLVAERKITIPDKLKSNKDEDQRMNWYAAYLEASDAERAAGGITASDLIDYAEGLRMVTGDSTSTEIITRQERAGGILRQITTTVITRTVTSVPSTTPPEESDDRPIIPPKDVHALMDEELQQFLLSAKLNVTGDRETDIDTYRVWRRKILAEPQQVPNPPKVNVWEEVGGKEESSVIFHTIINVQTSPKSSVVGSVGKPKWIAEKPPRPEDESTSVPGPFEDRDEEHLDLEEHEYSPEPLSPVVNDYGTWSAAKLKREAAARDPPIKIPSKQRAAETIRTVPPLLKALDGQAREARNIIRAEKRKGVPARREAVKKGERPAKRLKPTLTDKGKEKGREAAIELKPPEGYEGGAAEVGFKSRIEEEDDDQVEGQEGEHEEQMEVSLDSTGEVTSTPAQTAFQSEGFVVETPAKGGDSESLEL